MALGCLTWALMALWLPGSWEKAPPSNHVLVSQEYRPRTFWVNMADAAFQSLVCFFIPYLVSWQLAQSLPSASSSDPQTQDTAVFQAYHDSDTDVFTWGTPITTIALLTFLLHLGIETKTWVRAVGMIQRVLRLWAPHFHAHP